MELHHRLRRDPSWHPSGCNICGQVRSLAEAAPAARESPLLLLLLLLLLATRPPACFDHV